MESMNLKDIWKTYFANTPNDFSEVKMPNIVFPPVNNATYTYDRNNSKRQSCEGNAFSSFDGQIEVSVVRISAAFLWTPRPSVGLPQVTQEDV